MYLRKSVVCIKLTPHLHNWRKLSWVDKLYYDWYFSGQSAPDLGMCLGWSIDDDSYLRILEDDS